ncbi:reverse transcriptase domain-containing protein [Tanacetum coccineum]
MSDMTACLNDLSYIPPNNEQNEPTQRDIGEISNESTQAKRGISYQTSLMLTLLIPGPKSLGKDIDVYLRPLIDDLKDLWELAGVDTIDAATGKTFNMRAMLL